jgi:hypothetical protein
VLIWGRGFIGPGDSGKPHRSNIKYRGVVVAVALAGGGCCQRNPCKGCNIETGWGGSAFWYFSGDS